MNRIDGIARLTLVVVLLATVVATLAARHVVAEPAPLVVAAASDLRPAFDEIGALFEKSAGRRVDFVYGSSGMLSQQLAAGAPYDVFASADPAYIDGLQEKGVIVAATRHIFALGRIVLVVRADGARPVEQVEDLLQPSIRTICIANPDHAPYGAAARAALQAAGVWEQVKRRIVYADNAAMAVQFLESGNADAGIVPLSLATAAGLAFSPINAELYDPLQQTIVAVQNSRHAELVREFLAFIDDPQSQRILSAYGYVLTGER